MLRTGGSFRYASCRDGEEIASFTVRSTRSGLQTAGPDLHLGGFPDGVSLETITFSNRPAAAPGSPLTVTTPSGARHDLVERHGSWGRRGARSSTPCWPLGQAARGAVALIQRIVVVRGGEPGAAGSSDRAHSTPRRVRPGGWRSSCTRAESPSRRGGCQPVLAPATRSRTRAWTGQGIGEFRGIGRSVNLGARRCRAISTSGQGRKSRRCRHRYRRFALSGPSRCHRHPGVRDIQASP
jgi:hypothetical protein